MHWKLKLSWALFLVPLVVGAAWSTIAATPIPIVVAVLLVGVVFDEPLRELRRRGHEES